jgi:hypothetical protein
VLDGLLKFENILPRIWDPDRFANEVVVGDGAGITRLDEEDKTNLNFGLLTEAIRSVQWWAYSRMIRALHRCTGDLEGWAEGCPCHYFLQPFRGGVGGRERIVPAAARRLDGERRALGFERGQFAGTDGSMFACPMRGKRAVELARGVVTDLIAEFVQSATTSLLAELPPSLSAGDASSVLSDFQLGKAHMTEQIILKMRHWTLLPWTLPALGDWDEPRARQSALRVRTMFDQIGHQQELHHRISWHWLRPGSEVRAQIDKFIAGTPRDDLPLLSRLCAEMVFVPVAERCQEAQHSLVNRMVGSRKVSGPYVSLILRMPEIERSLSVHTKDHCISVVVFSWGSDIARCRALLFILQGSTVARDSALPYI